MPNVYKNISLTLHRKYVHGFVKLSRQTMRFHQAKRLPPGPKKLPVFSGCSRLRPTGGGPWRFFLGRTMVQYSLHQAPFFSKSDG